jgi:hypothetical protein
MRSSGVVMTCIFVGACATEAEDSIERAPAPPSTGSSGSTAAGAGAGAGGMLAKGGSPPLGGSAGSLTAGNAGSNENGGISGSSGSGGSGGARLPSGDLLFSDDFETSNAEDWIANTQGDWSIVTDETNVYEQATMSNNFRVAVAGDAAWTDQVVEARVKVLSFGGGSTSYLVGVYARFQDLDNHYYVALREDGKVAIRMRLEGSSTTLGSAVEAGIVPGTWYEVRLEAVGSSLTAYLDGELKVTVTDGSISAGAVGLGSTNATAVFDDVAVSAP